MAKYEIPYQELSFAIPDDGEVFLLDDSGQTIGVRKGNEVFSYDLGTLNNLISPYVSRDENGNHVFEYNGQKQVYGGNPTGAFIQWSLQVLNNEHNVNLGENRGDLQNNLTYYNPGDVGTAFNHLGQVNRATDPSVFNSTVDESKKGEVLTQQLSSANVHSPVVTSSISGVLYDPEGAGANPDGTLQDIYGSVGQTAPTVEPYTAPPVSTTTPNNSTGTTTGGATGGQTGGQQGSNTLPQEVQDAIANADTEFDQQLQALLDSGAITPDQRAVIEQIFQAVSTYDQNTADRLTAAFQAAKEINDPFFKAQIRLVEDALQRGFARLDEDLQIKEQNYQTMLADLRQDIQRNKELYTLEEQSQLRAIERQFTQQLEQTQNTLAATGFTQSSRRQTQENVLQEARGDLVEGTTREFGARREDLDIKGQRAERDVASEIDRLRQLTTRSKEDIFRQAEEQLGSEGLGSLGGLSGAPNPLGDIPGTIPQAQARDTLSFASSFIF